MGFGRPSREQPLGVGGHVAAFGIVAVALLPEYRAVGTDQHRAEGMIAVSRERRATSNERRRNASWSSAGSAGGGAAAVESIVVRSLVFEARAWAVGAS